MSGVAAFSWKDPKTGITYKGAEGQARWVASLTGQAAPPAKGQAPGSLPLPPPPVGTYDPALDYNATASQTGYDQTRDDASTLYEQGQEDYGLAKGDLTTGRDRTLGGLLTGNQRLNEDYGLATKENVRQYGILGNQQAERAAQQGITSAGLLGKSASVRGANQARDQSGLDLSRDRGNADYATNVTDTNEDFDRGLLGLNLGNARQFGGFQGNTILNPLTGKPQVGSLLTSLTRAGGANNTFQTFTAGQRTQQAAANGYLPPVSPTDPASAKAFMKKLKPTGWAG